MKRLLSTVATLLLAGTVLAQTYPAKPIKFIVPFSAGSATDIVDSGLPILAIPTTYAGSEMTPIYGITEAGMKKTGRDLRVLPRTVIYDPKLTLSLPLLMSVTSGINAIAHAAEGLPAQTQTTHALTLAEMLAGLGGLHHSYRRAA